MADSGNMPGSSPPAFEHPTIDLHAYWRVIVRRRWVVIPFFAAAVLVTAAVTLRMTKYYDSICTIIIEVAAPKVLEKEVVQDVVESGTGGYWYSREYYETQYRVITSRSVAQRVVEKLGLASNRAFLGLSQPDSRAGLEDPRHRPDAIAIVQGRLALEPVKDSRVVRIHYEDPDPQLAALIANTVAEAYIAENLAVKSTTTASAADWLEQQLADLEGKLETSGKALFEFKRTHDIVATSWEDRQSMVSQRLTTVNDALTRARVRKAELQARNDAIEALASSIDRGAIAPEAGALQGVMSSLTIQQLKSRWFDAQAECADLRLKYLEHHPRLEACDRKLALAKDALKGEVLATLRAAREEHKEAVKTEQNLLALLNETKADAFRLNQFERDYIELKRSYDNNQRLYDLVLKRLKDTGVAGMLQVSNVRILDRARPSEKPARPDVLRHLLVAIVLGLFGGVAMAFLAESIDRTITTQEQIEETLALPLLGVLPTIPASSRGTSHDLIAHTNPTSSIAECLRVVRTNLLFMSPERPLRTLLITSSGPQEGKTTAATSLAVTMAESGNRVLLVDGDMRRPRIHRVFGAVNDLGLSSLILGDGQLVDAVRSTEVPNLSVVTSGPVPPNPAELLHTESFRRLLAEMAGSYDRVIIDSPPGGVVADSIVMATLVDGTMFVLKAGKTSRDAAARAVRQLRDVNARLLGALLNDLDLSDQKYSYYYQYGSYSTEKVSESPGSA